MARRVLNYGWDSTVQIVLLLGFTGPRVITLRALVEVVVGAEEEVVEVEEEEGKEVVTEK